MKSRARPKAKPMTYELAFALWQEHDAVADPATRKKIKNKIIPANVQAAAQVRTNIRREGWRWFQQHGFDANIAHCIEHLRANGWTTRRSQKRGDDRQLTDSEVRKVLRSLGVKGKAGRPKRS
jgi:hypothetical protein